MKGRSIMFLTVVAALAIIGCNDHKEEVDEANARTNAAEAETARIKAETDNTPKREMNMPAPAPALLGMTITPNPVVPGTKFVITVTVSTAAPAGGVSVALTMDNAVQNPIVIPAGQNSGSITYTAGNGADGFTFACSYAGVRCAAVQRTAIVSNIAATGSSNTGGNATTDIRSARRAELTADIASNEAALPQARILDEENKQWNQDQISKQLEAGSKEQQKINELREDGETEEADRRQKILNLTAIGVGLIDLGVHWQRSTDNAEKLEAKIVADRNELQQLQ